MKDTVENAHPDNGARLVSVEGRELPLRSVDVTGQAQGGLARVVLKQTFANPHDEPLKVAYTLPLPADGAVAGYEFRVGPRRVIGEIDRRAEARRRFEKALVEGRTAGILDEERANLFTQEIGNVPPRTEVVVDLSIDQPLVWLPEGMWEWRFPTVAPPRYLGAEGRVADAAKVTVEVADGPTGARASLDLAIGDRLAEGGRPESTSHPLSISGHGVGARVRLAGESGVALDRDLVVRWAVPRPRAGASLQTARPVAARPHAGRGYGLLTLVPPESPIAVYPRDLIVLIDTSGSMTGRPLDQARRVVAALVDTLLDSDRLEMISFSNEPRRWRPEPLPATGDTLRDAHRWLGALRAGGGTELLGGVAEALKPLRPESQRQVVLVTDGQIGFESEIVRALKHDLPRGSRLHAVAVGASPNRALTRPAARAGRGVEVLAPIDEDAERAAARLIRATRGPAIVDLEIQGSAVTGFAPRPLPDLMAGAPVLVGLSLRPEGGDLVVRGRTPGGVWEERLAVQPTETGAGIPGVVAFYGRESVENLELELAAGALRSEIEPAIETIGLEFGLSTRLTSWVAISEEPNVDPRLPVRRETVPQELPYGMSAEGLGLRRTGLAGLVRYTVMSDSMAQEVAGVTRSVPSMPASIRHAMKTYLTDLILRKSKARVGFLSGRWTGSAEGSGQVLEFEVTEAAFQWQIPGHATLHLGSGKSMRVPVIPSATTAPSAIKPGSLVRLTLQFEGIALEDVLMVEIDCGGAPRWIIF